MFKRSIKYLVLVVINIVILAAFYIQQNQKDSDAIDTDYMISLLDANTKLEAEIEALEAKNSLLESSSESAQTQLTQTRGLVDRNIAQLAQCRNDQAATLALSKQQARERAKITSSQVYNAEECSDNAVQASFLGKQLNSMKERMADLNNKNSDLSTQTQVLRNELAKVNEESLRFSKEKLRLQETIRELEKDLSSNIYLKQVYTTPTYCQPPRFEELVCVERLLVRPQFSKKPTTDVRTTLRDPNGKVIGRFSFDSTKAKLINFPFPRDSESQAGEYTVTFEVNEMELVEKLELKH